MDSQPLISSERRVLMARCNIWRNRNHQTHHRGQADAMLTAAGAKPDDTDLFLLPEDI